MNRIQLGHTLDGKAWYSSQRLEQAILSSAPPTSVPHTLFAPLHYEPNYPYPLLVWLHGPGDDERQLLRIMPQVSMRNYVAVAPRGTCSSEPSARGFRWRQTSSEITQASHRVWDCIELAMQRYHVSPQRIFIGGYACGGTMAFRLAMLEPHRFAGVLSIAGPFPNTATPLANVERARRLPLFIAQGRRSLDYPPERTCRELRLFHAAGFAVTLRQYPCGDELTRQMLHDMNVWMMDQVTGQQDTADSGQSGREV